MIHNLQSRLLLTSMLSIILFSGVTTFPSAFAVTANDDGSVGTPFGITDEDNSFVTGDVLANDDPGVIINNDPVSVGGASINYTGAGTFLYDPIDQFQYLAVGEFFDDTFTYEIQDTNSSDTDTATVTIHVDGLNDPPNTQPDAFVQNEDDAPLFGNLFVDNGQGPDIDPDTSDSFEVTLVNGLNDIGVEIALPSGALLTVNANGDFDYDQNGSFNSLSSGDQYLDFFNYTIDDGNGGFSAGGVEITIIGLNVNHAPVAIDDTDSTDEDTPILLAGDVTANDTDADADVLTVTPIGPVAGSSGGLFTIDMNGTYSFDPNGEFEGLGTGQFVETFVNYTVSDGTDNDEGRLTVTVTGVNDAPVITVNGTNPVNWHEAGLVYGDAEDSAAGGVTATDAEEGDVTHLIVADYSAIIETPGSYNVTYSVTDTDAPNNISPQTDNDDTRTVIVKDTISPVLSLNGDDRKEADSSGQQTFEVTVTATDAPRTDAPQVTCTDESNNTVIDSSGGYTNSSAGPYDKGVQTINCVADDGSIDSSNDMGSFDLAVAEIDITEICLAGISTGGNLTCTPITPGGDGGDTVTVDAKWGIPIFVFSEGFFGGSSSFDENDVDGVAVRGTVWGYNTTSPANLTLSWGAIDGLEPSLTPEDLNQNGNQDDGADFELFHFYSMNASNNVEQISAVLEGSIVATSNLNVEVNVTKRATSTDLVLSDTNVLWDHLLAGNNVTVLDIDANPPIGIANLTVNFGSPGVAAGQEATTSDGTDSDLLGIRTIDLQAGTAAAALNGPSYNVTSTFAGDNFYLASDDEDELTLDPHTTTTTTVVTEDSVLWDHFFHATTTIIDNQAIISGGIINNDSGSNLDPVTFTYSGAGVAGEDLQRHNSTTPLTSNGVNSTATTEEIALQAGNANSADGVTPQDVIATFAGNAAYLGSADQTDSIILEKHSTTTSLDGLVDLVAGTAFTPSGLVTDNDKILMNNSTNEAALGGPYDPTGITSNFVSFDTGSFVGKTVTLSGTGIGDLDLDTTIRGLTITDPNGNFTTNDFGFKVLELHPGAIITVPEDSVGVTLEIRNLDSTDTATFNVTSPNSPQNSTILVEGTDLTQEDADQDGQLDPPNYVTTMFTQNGAVTEIRLLSLDIASGDTALEVTAFAISDPEGEPQVIFSVELNGDNAVPEEELVFGVNDSITFIDGAFHGIVLTELEQASGLNVTASFAGSDEYEPSVSETLDFDTIFSSWGVGGNAAIAPDSGTGFTSVACGADKDGDSICDGWEFNKRILYVSAEGDLPYNLTAADNRFGSPLPSPALAHKDIYVEVDYMEGHKPDEVALRDAISEFFSAKTSPPAGVSDGISLNIFVDEEITHVDNLNVWTDNDNNVTNDFTSIKSRHFGIPQERANMTGTQSSSITLGAGTDPDRIDITGISIDTPNDHDQGTITIQERITVDGIDVPTISSVSWSPSGGTTDFTMLLGSATKSITEESAGVYIVKVEIPYKAFDPLSNRSIGTVKIFIDTDDDVTDSSTYRNSPVAISNLIKAKAYIYHYFIWAHSIGECGPSGVAETDGNDGIVSLGCNFTTDEVGADLDSNGNDRTVGSRQEQAGTFVHELGHNLGLLHGGPRVDASDVEIPDSAINCKSNYLSVMSYARQIPGTQLLSVGQFSPSYSSGNLADLNETKLDEQLGIDSPDDATIIYGTGIIRKANTYNSVGGDPAVKINWNGNGVFDAGFVTGDPNNLGFSGCEASAGQYYSDHDDWSLLNYNFRGATGNAFDGFSGDPKKVADYTPVIEGEIESTGLYYTGTFDPIDPTSNNSEPPYSTFKLGSTVPFKFQLWSCNPHEDTEAVICIDEEGIFSGGVGETLTCPTFGVDGCKEKSLELLPNEMIFLQTTKISDSVAYGDDVFDISDLPASSGYFEWKDDHYQFNWDTSNLLGDIKGKGKKDAGVGGDYALLAVHLEDGVPTLLVDNNNEFFLPNDLDRAEPLCAEPADEPGCFDPDSGFPVSMIVSLID